MSTRARFAPKTASVLALLGTVAALGAALGGCGDSTSTDPADAFVGTWHYDQSTGSIVCPNSDPIDEAPIGNKTFGLGVSAPLVDLTPSPFDPATFCNTDFDISASGAVATARTDASCTVTGGDVVTIGAWTFSLTSATTAVEKAAATIHITMSPVAPATTPTTSTCAFTSMAVLTRVAKD
jgi:hypothetical protein